MMDHILELLENQYPEEVQFLVSLDYSQNENDLYSCQDWENLYTELGDFNNNPLIVDCDPDHRIWEMFAETTYSAYAFLDHNMVLRYKFNMPNLYDFVYIYTPNLVDAMYGCTDPNACNFDMNAVYDNSSCEYENECNFCIDAETQSECMNINNCMWMGDHCMYSNDNCMEYDNEFECMGISGCYWMGNHCMSGSTCSDPIAYNYNPIADVMGSEDNTECQYSSFINFGCTYSSANNFDPSANVDDGSCQYNFADLNQDGSINVLDIMHIVNIILGSD